MENSTTNKPNKPISDKQRLCFATPSKQRHLWTTTQSRKRAGRNSCPPRANVDTRLEQGDTSGHSRPP